MLLHSYGNYWFRLRSNERIHPHCVEHTVKHGSVKLVVWGFFCVEGTVPLVRINGVINQDVYKDILAHHAKPALLIKTNNYSVSIHFL